MNTVHSFCRLAEIMTERRLTVSKLSKATGVSRRTIIALRRNEYVNVNMDAVSKILAFLDISYDDLFEVRRRDLFYPVRLGRQVTVHVASNSFFETMEAEPIEGVAAPIDRPFVAAWDFRAIMIVAESVLALGPDIELRFEEHPVTVDPAEDYIKRLLEEPRNQVVIGSSLTSQFTEELFAQMMGVNPNSPRERDRSPYGFQWNTSISTNSSFGWRGAGLKEFGIWSFRENKLVARRTFAGPGMGGTDCALVVTYRIYVPPRDRKSRGDDSRLVVLLLGHSGAGTFAAARFLSNPENSRALYPSSCGRPRLSVLEMGYLRRPGPERQDNRRTTRCRLVESVEIVPGVPGGRAPTLVPDGPDPEGSAPGPGIKRGMSAAAAGRRSGSHERRAAGGRR